MKPVYILMFFLFSLLTLNTVFAEDEVRPLSREEMEAMLTAQELRVRELSEAFFALNETIESRIQKVVETLAALEDSPASKTRVSRMKSRLIDDLKSSLHALSNQRSANVASLTGLSETGRAEAPATFANEVLEDKIKNRFELVMTLAGSLHQNREVDKYEYYVRDRYDGDGLEVDRRVSPEHRRNEMLSSRANLDRKDLLENLEAEEFRLTQKINHIQAEATSSGLSQPSEPQANEVKHFEELRDILRAKRQEILLGEQQEDTRPVADMAQAMSLEAELSRVVAELRVANQELRQKGIELGRELQRLAAQRRILSESATP